VREQCAEACANPSRKLGVAAWVNRGGTPEAEAGPESRVVAGREGPEANVGEPRAALSF